MVNKADSLNALLSYFRYLITAKHRKGHSIHSPAVFELVSNVICDKTIYDDYKFFRQQIKLLQKQNNNLVYEKYGAGSKVFTKSKRRVSRIIDKSSVSEKYGRLLYRLVAFYKPATIIELGTSIGISTMYLSKGADGLASKFYTVEAGDALVDFASGWLGQAHCTNITFIRSEFDKALPTLIEQIKQPALVFIDGNHTYDATLRYVNQLKQSIVKGFIVIDDIYWSRDMERAWKEIKRQGNVTVDLYSMGIVLIGDMITPGNYTIRF
jgi:predicted O-methyltransferase YrrM